MPTDGYFFPCIAKNLCSYLYFKIKYPIIPQMEASYVSMILFVSQAWDAVTDPLVGYLVSRSKWSPIGKLTPWLVGGAMFNTHFTLKHSFKRDNQCLFHRLVLSTPFGVLSYLLLWFVPRGSMSQPLSVLWFLTATCLFETLMSVSHC